MYNNIQLFTVQQCSALCNNAEPCNIPSPANGFDLTAD
jgi:hypothetical protein